MPPIRIFTDMNQEEKMQFFQRCQDLLIKTNPNSPYILKKDGPSRNKNYFIDIFLKYQGFVYETDAIILLFNKLHFENTNDIYDRYRNRLFDTPDENPNTYTVDFIASKLDPEILSGMEPYFKDAGMKWVCFLRGQKLSIFDAETFKNGVKDRFGLI